MDARPTPEETRPPLTAWGQAWRLGLCVLFGLLVWSTAIEEEWRSERGIFWIEIGLGVVALTLVMFRRRAPVPIAIVTALLSCGSGLGAAAATLAAVSVATLRRPWPIIGVGLLNFACSNVYSFYAPFSADPRVGVTVLVNAVANTAMMGWGMYIGSRREILWTLHRRAERAEAEQSLRVEQGRSHERERIAREMHDVLAHRLTQVSMQAGALSFRDDLDRDSLRSGLAEVQGKTNEALHELRGVLGVLRDADGRAIDAPQPRYDDIGAMIEEGRGNGINVEYDDLVDRAGPEMPDAVGRAVYRIVQESLTNASKHAPGALVTVRLTGNPQDGIDVLIRNPLGFGRGETPGAGLGLVGLAERAELRGGTLRHGVSGSMFVVHASIPWSA